MCDECRVKNSNPFISGECKCPEGSNLGVNECICIEGKFITKDSLGKFVCRDCHKSCKVCNDTNEKGCLQCLEPYIRGSVDDLCTLCDDGYSVNGTCYKCEPGYRVHNNSCKNNTFRSYSYVADSYILWIIFNESLLLDLKASDITVFVDSNQVDFKLIRADGKLKYGLKPILYEIYRNSIIEVKLKSGILSEKFSILNNTYYKGIINFKGKDYIEQKYSDEAKEQEQFANDGATTGLIITLGISFLTLDTNSVFNLINTDELIYSIYLLDLEINPILREFLLGLRVQKSTPNLFKNFIPEEKGLKLTTKFKKYGYKSNLVMINAGILLTLLGIKVAFIILLAILSFIPKIREKAVSAISWITTKLLSKFWIQSFFEFIVTSSVTAKYNINLNEYQIVDSAMFFVIIVLEFAFVFNLIRLIRVRLSITVPKMLEEFENKYSVFFIEFRNESRAQSFFILIFFIRRFLIAIVSQSELSGITQIILVVIFNFSVLIYILSTRCFKKNILNIFHAITEFFIVCINSLIIYGYYQNELYEYNRISVICIRFIYASWAANSFASLYLLISNLIMKFRGLKKIFSNRRSNQVIQFTNEKKSNFENKTQEQQVW